MTTEVDSVAQITHDTAHVAEALAHFYREFRNATKLQAFCAAWAVQIQAVEDAFWELLTCTLDNAIGAALDQIGAALGFPRGSLSDDEDYRPILRAVVLARRSSGRADDLIAVMAAALGSTAFAYAEGSASALLTPAAPITFDPAALLAVLVMAKSGGVELQLVTPPLASSNLFTLSADPFRSTTSAAQGLADTAQTTGGHFTGVIA